MTSPSAKAAQQIPDWMVAADKFHAQQPMTALELFIFHQEPAGQGEHDFREQLSAALSEAVRPYEELARIIRAHINDDDYIDIDCLRSEVRDALSFIPALSQPKGGAKP